VPDGHWTVLAADPTGKRLVCRCVCGRVMVVARAALERGACCSCGCRPLRPLGFNALRGRALAGSLPALERLFIASTRMLRARHGSESQYHRPWARARTATI
jgi:hypothetical protein